MVTTGGKCDEACQGKNSLTLIKWTKGKAGGLYGVIVSYSSSTVQTSLTSYVEVEGHLTDLPPLQYEEVAYT